MHENLLENQQPDVLEHVVQKHIVGPRNVRENPNPLGGANALSRWLAG